MAGGGLDNRDCPKLNVGLPIANDSMGDISPETFGVCLVATTTIAEFACRARPITWREASGQVAEINGRPLR